MDDSFETLLAWLSVLGLGMVFRGGGAVTMEAWSIVCSGGDGDCVCKLAIAFLFLGGGMLTFSTSSHAIAALLITLNPRLRSGPNDNHCHLQAYRHMYVLATEPWCIQTVDVDTGLPVYAPLEITVKETDNHIETSFCEISMIELTELCFFELKAVRACGPWYWPQVIELVPEDKAWWSSGVESHPFNSGILYVKRKVGACSYLDDPIGCQSLLSRAMHKAFSLTSTRACRSSGESASVQVDQLVSVSDNDFQEFCLQVLSDCVSNDRPALLQVYLSLYTALRSMADQVHSEKLTDADSLLMLNLKLALAYGEAILKGKLTSSIGGIVQLVFLSSLRNRVEEIFSYMPGLKDDFSNYVISGTWPTDGGRRSIFLAWHLQCFDVPSPSIVEKAVERIQQKLGTSLSIPLLHLLLPKTHITVITAIHKFSAPFKDESESWAKYI
ncbi:Anaphase-promoting complex subunit 1-like protein [Drosera capensis]